MAIYHLHCDIIGRSGGRSATAAAAYRATCKIEDRTTGEKFDYRKKEKAVYSAIWTPREFPSWAKNRSELWNSCEEKENRKNSQFCRSFDIALMKEFDLETNLKCLAEWVAENYLKRGLVADVAIHSPHKNKDGTTNENSHAHVLVTTRKVDKDGWTEKDREGNDIQFLKKARTSWADIVNKKFLELGMSERIDERTLEAQGIDREPQQHLGAKATAMQRKGKETDRKKYKSQEENQEQNQIEVAEEEVLKAIQNDTQFQELLRQKDKLLKEIEEQKKAKELTPDQKEFLKWQDRILKMSPKEWQEFMKGDGQKNLQDWCYGEYVTTQKNAIVKSQVMWVENNINEVTKYFQAQRHELVTKCNNWENSHSRPWGDAKEKSKLFGRDWYTSDGEHFGDHPIEARIHQQQLRREYDKEHDPIRRDAELSISEHNDCLNKNYEQVRLNILRHHKSLSEKLIDGSIKIYRESPVFAPVRAMVGAVKSFGDMMNKKLHEYQAQKKLEKLQNKKIDNDIGRGM